MATSKLTPAKLDELFERLRKHQRAFPNSYNTLRYFPHAIGLRQKPNATQIAWIHRHTKGEWSVDQTCSPYNISFELKSDIIMVKLSYPYQDLFCKKHETY